MTETLIFESEALVMKQLTHDTYEPTHSPPSLFLLLARSSAAPQGSLLWTDNKERYVEIQN